MTAMQPRYASFRVEEFNAEGDWQLVSSWPQRSLADRHASIVGIKGALVRVVDETDEVREHLLWGLGAMRRHVARFDRARTSLTHIGLTDILDEALCARLQKQIEETEELLGQEVPVRSLVELERGAP